MVTLFSPDAPYFNKSRGGVIVLEGVDGMGKTTLVRKIVADLGDSGLPIVAYKEPPLYQIRYNELYRDIKHVAGEGQREIEYNQYLIDRVSSMAADIQALVHLGQWVIVDRYAASTLVYNATTLRRTETLLKGVEERRVPKPDLTICLNPTPAGVNAAYSAITKRILARGNDTVVPWDDYKYMVAKYTKYLKHDPDALLISPFVESGAAKGPGEIMAAVRRFLANRA